MRRCLGKTMKNHRLGIVAVALSLFVAVGCSMGPSPKELDALEASRQAMTSSEAKIAAKQVEKASLERKLGDRKAEKRALTEKKAETRANMAEADTQ